AKNPAERPATADEVLRQLEAAGSLSTAPAMGAFAYGRGFFLPAMGIYAATFLIVAIVARLLVDTQGLPEWVFTGALVVMALGFPVVLFTGYTQYVARKVAQSTPALARDLAQREGIKAVVGGTITPVGGSYIVTARLVNAQSGDELAVFRETAKDAEDIIPTVDRLTRQLRGRIGESLKSVKDAPAL